MPHKFPRLARWRDGLIARLALDLDKPRIAIFFFLGSPGASAEHAASVGVRDHDFVPVIGSESTLFTLPSKRDRRIRLPFARPCSAIRQWTDNHRRGQPK